MQKLTIYKIDSFFAKANDEYDVISSLGKLMNEFNIGDDIKDKLKEVVKEAIDYGFNLGIQEGKR